MRVTREEGRTPTTPWLSTSGLHGALPKSGQPIIHPAHHDLINDILAVFALPPPLPFAWGLNKKDNMSCCDVLDSDGEISKARELAGNLGEVCSTVCRIQYCGALPTKIIVSSTHRLKGVYHGENHLRVCKRVSPLKPKLPRIEFLPEVLF